MTQSNPVSTPEELAAQNTKQVSSVFRVAVIMLAAAFTVEAFYLFLAVQMGAWQMYALAGVIAFFCIVNIIALPVIKTGHTTAGGWLMVIGMLLVFPAASALIANTGIIFGSALIMLTIVIAGQTLPGSQVRTAIIASIVAGILAVVFDYIGLDYRLFVPEIQVFIPVITAIILLVLLIAIIRQVWNKINKSISNRLTALVLAVTVPFLIGVTAYISNRAGSEIEAQALHNLQQNNQALTTNVSTWLELHVRSIQEMALLPDIKSMNATRQKPTLLAIASAHPNLFLVHTTNIDGINVARNDDADLTDYHDRAWFLGARGESPITFEALISRTIGKPALNMSTPIYNGSGEIVGVASIVSELSEISKEVLNTEEGGGITYIVDANNRVVAHPDQSYTEGELRDLSAYPPVAALREGKTGQKITFIDENGVTWIAFVDRLDNGWGIIAQQPEAELLAPVRQFQTVSIILIFIGSAVMFALAWFAIRRSLQPIGALTTTVSAIAAGDLSRIADVKSQDEIGILASTFNTMTAQLRDFIGTLESRVADRTRGLELAAEVGRSVSRVRTLDEMLRDAAEIVRTQFNLYYVQVYLVDASRTNLVLQSGTGSVGAELVGRAHRLTLNTASINGRAAIEKRSVVVSDTAASPDFRPNPLLPETRSEMAVPLLLGDQIVGVLDLQSVEANALNQDNLPAFEALAGQIAVAIQNANLLEQAEQARAEVEVQARRLVRTGWQEHLDAIHRPEQTGFSFEKNQVTPLDEDLYFGQQLDALVVPITFTGQQLGSLVVDMEQELQTPQTVELVNIVARQVAQQVENLRLLESAERYRLEAENAARRLTREGWEEYFSAKSGQTLGYLYDLKEVRPHKSGVEFDANSSLSLPIKVRDETIGKLAVLGVDSTDPETLALVNTVSERLSEHIESIRLLEETQLGQMELNKRARQLAAVSQISTLSSRELDVQKMLATVVQMAQRQFGLYHAHIFTYNEAANQLEIVACGWKEGSEYEGTHGTTTISLDQEQSLVARAARTRAPVAVNDVRADPNWLPNPQLPDTISELAVPLVIGDEVLGVLDVQSEHANAFSDADINIQSTLAAQVATALQNARSFARSQRQAEREATLNAISQKIQSATSVEAVLQIAARELGHALGAPRTIAQLSMKDNK